MEMTSIIGVKWIKVQVQAEVRKHGRVRVLTKAFS